MSRISYLFVMDNEKWTTHTLSICAPLDAVRGRGRGSDIKVIRGLEEDTLPILSTPFETVHSYSDKESREGKPIQEEKKKRKKVKTYAKERRVKGSSRPASSSFRSSLTHASTSSHREIDESQVEKEQVVGCGLGVATHTSLTVHVPERGPAERTCGDSPTCDTGEYSFFTKDEPVAIRRSLRLSSRLITRTDTAFSLVPKRRREPMMEATTVTTMKKSRLCLSSLPEHKEEKEEEKKEEKAVERENKETKIIVEPDKDEAAEAEMVELERIRVCATILSGHSKFFENLFSNGMKESSEKTIRIVVKDASEAKTFVNLIRCMSASGLDEACREMTCEDILNLLVCADAKEVKAVVMDCVEALGARLTSESCVQCMSLPITLLQSDAGLRLVSMVYAFMVKEWKQDLEHKWHSSTEFLELPLSLVTCILASDELRIRSENTLFQAMCRWWTHNVATLAKQSLDRCVTRLPSTSLLSLPDAATVQPLDKGVSMVTWSKAFVSSDDEKSVQTRVAWCLLSNVRWIHFTKDFFMDIVQYHPQMISYYMQSPIIERIRDATRFHSFSKDRQESSVCRDLVASVPKRIGFGEAVKHTEFTWNVEGTAAARSECLWIDGYAFCLELREEEADPPCALFLTLLLDQTGATCGDIATCRPFSEGGSSLYLKLHWTFYALDHVAGHYKELKNCHFTDAFARPAQGATPVVLSKGRRDVFRLPLSRLIHSECPFISPSGHLSFRLRARFD